MRRHRVFLFLLLAATLLTAGYLTLRGFDLLEWTAAQVRPVPAGHQEIAFLMPATGGETWERLVAALDALAKEWPAHYPGPRLRLAKEKAFVELTADVAELAVWLDGAEDQRLWIRWYKLTSDNGPARWIEKLAGRDRPPLAVIGGDVSDRALAIGLALEQQRQHWRGPAPLFLMTTATADRYNPIASPNEDHASEHLPKLINIYLGRSFRFSFTNRYMAQAVLDFVRAHPALWPQNGRQATPPAGAAAAADPWTALGLLAAAEAGQQYALHTLTWNDDSYSLDLAARFARVFPDVFKQYNIDPNFIAYSTGDYYHPNPREAIAVGLFLRNNPDLQDGRHLLVLPTSAQRAQRLVRTLVRRDPVRARNLVVVTGDSISFNNIYRDRNVSWNIQDVPVPLVLFAHRNPVNATVGFRAKGGGGSESCCTSTDDLLLYRDLLEALVQSAYRDNRLLADADALRERLAGALWNKGHVEVAGFGGRAARSTVRLFDADGNRSGRTGEHVVWLRPSGGRAEDLAQATISVWRRRPEGFPGDGWVQAAEELNVRYDAAGLFRSEE